MMDIALNLMHLQKQIHEYEQKYGRPKGSVQLLAVSKDQSLEKIQLAYQAGLRSFGENYLQEALVKITAMTELHPENTIEWHFIGPIQRNKTKKIAEHFAWVQSVSDTIIAKRLNDQRPLSLPPLNICIQINVSNEETKQGVTFDEAEALITYCLTLPRLNTRGLMAIPALQENMIDQRHAFHQLFLLWQSLRQRGFQLDTLSMGMTHDFEAAIAEGTTMIRIGTGIFGERLK